MRHLKGEFLKKDSPFFFGVGRGVRVALQLVGGNAIIPETIVSYAVHFFVYPPYEKSTLFTFFMDEKIVGWRRVHRTQRAMHFPFGPFWVIAFPHACRRVYHLS